MREERYVNQLRRSCPAMGFRADYGGSRVAAIRMFCVECCGGTRKFVDQCKDYACPLWPFRGSGPKKRPSGTVPSKKEYDEMRAKSDEEDEDA